MKTRVFLLVLLMMSFGHFTFGKQDSLLQEKPTLTEGLFYQVGLGLMAYERQNNNKAYDASFSATVGYSLHWLLQPGITIGYEDYNEFNSMPISAYLAGNFLKSDHSPFYYANVGYAHFFKESESNYQEITGGSNVEAGVGYLWQLDKVKLRLSTGWKRQRLQTEMENNSYFTSDALFSSTYNPPLGEKKSWRMDRIVWRVVIEF